MDITNLSYKNIRSAFLFIFLIELISLSGYLVPAISKIAFFIIVLLTFILSIYKLEYGIYIALAELFIGSKGYLFYFEIGGISVSIRIALWLIIMSVWLSQLIIHLAKRGEIKTQFLKSYNSKYLIIFFIFILWGVINGILNKNKLDNIFFDFNNWLYFLLIFPIFEAINTKEKLINVFEVFCAAIFWLTLKTFFLLFVFSHNLIGMVYELYRWVRVTGVGEITQMPSGFVRIFFQSHIFVLMGLFIFILFLIKFLFENKENLNFKRLLINKRFLILLSGLVLLFSTIILSFSRSYWVGWGGGLAIYAVILIFRAVKKEINFKQLISPVVTLFVSIVLSISVIAVIVKFPYPKPSAYFSTDLLSDRALNLSEAGASSRWSLLPKLWLSIKETPFVGKGFGATVTYISSDPRVLESNPKGEYTTYAFEWGWLDIWLKLGIFGLISYLILLSKLSFNLIGMEENKWALKSLGIGILVISLVNVFSPYLNHPLGIGYIILCFLVLETCIKNKFNIY